MICSDLNPFLDSKAYRRSACDVMRLERLGSAHPMRLSFLRILLRRVTDEKWQFDRPVFELDARGVGRVVYRAIGPERTYSLVCFAHDLPAEMRSDRVIATAWDATFTLFDGTPNAVDIDRLADNVPLQEAGRVSAKELTLSRANRSVRLFDHVVDSLSKGIQPDADQLAETGYLMRTTAVYGSGKFGALDREHIATRPEMMCPFQAEMLTVWLIRAFTVDLVEHLAKMRGGEKSVTLNAENRKALGVGNSTGLGMAPFLVRHPMLFNNWLMAREEALARVRCQAETSIDIIAGFQTALDAAIENANIWQSAHPLQIAKLQELRAGLHNLSAHVNNVWDFHDDHPWDALWHWGEVNLPIEAQECLLSIMLEPHGELIDGLAHCMSSNEPILKPLNGAMTVENLCNLIEANYDWALKPNYADESQSARFWYVSEDKLEPRLGERYEEPGSERELALDTGRQVKTLYEALLQSLPEMPIAELLLKQPEHRNAVRRIQSTVNRPFAEIQDNLIAADLMPIDMLRCKLAFFGANRFDPRSDRWVRISLFQGMPYPQDMASGQSL